MTEPPASEAEFIGLWKLYIVALIAQRMKEFDVKGTAAERLYKSLADQNLLESGADLSRIFRVAKEYARRWLAPKSVEAELKFDLAYRATYWREREDYTGGTTF